jgi:trigger factor
LLAEVSRENKLEVTQDELSQALTEEARRYPGQEREVYEHFQNHPEAMAQLQAPLLEEKAVDFIIELAEVTEKKVTHDELMRPPSEDEESEAEAKPKATKKKAAKKKTESDGEKKAPAKKAAAKKTEDKKPAAKKTAAKKSKDQKPAAKKAAPKKPAAKKPAAKKTPAKSAAKTTKKS